MILPLHVDIWNSYVYECYEYILLNTIAESMEQTIAPSSNRD